MKLCEKKYYNFYEVKRGEDGHIKDLYYIRQYETLDGKRASFKSNINDSKLVIDLDDIKTYYNGEIEQAVFLDYELIKDNKGVTLIDRRIKRVFHNLTNNNVMDYILASNYKESDALYSYNNGAIIVIR